MNRLASLTFCFALAAAGSTAANQFVARYLPLPSSGKAIVFAADAASNLFIVATVEEPSGRPQIRAIKTDAEGNVLGSFDFGGSYSTPHAAGVDPQGNLVVVGITLAQDFPLVLPLFTNTAPEAGFVVKLDSELTKIVFSTRLGGSAGGGPVRGGTSANAVAIDTKGNIYISGDTSTTDFPVTSGAFQSQPPGANAFGTALYAFVAELASSGQSLLYSTYFGADQTNCIGGSSCLGAFGATSAAAIAVDPAGAIVIGGYTSASQLPVTAGTLGQQCVCTNLIQAGFLAKFMPDGAGLKWATYVPLAEAGLPYVSNISINAVALDSAGNVLFAGTAPTGLVVSNGALQGMFPGGNSAPPDAPYAGFLAKVDSSADKYVFSTYFGGNLASPLGPNGIQALALDASGDIWITGGSSPTEIPFPATVPRLGPAYVAELAPDGSTLLREITAPAGAAGQSIEVGANGSVAALGSYGSLLLDLAGQPASLAGMSNAAGFHASSKIAPYELVSFYGVGIGPATALNGEVVNGVLSNSLGGVQVLFNQVAAPLLYAGPNQINAVVPSSVLGSDTATVDIVTPNGGLNGLVLAIVPSQPEVFGSPPSATEVVAGADALNQDGSLNSAANPAGAGSIVSIWATGAGMPFGPDADGSISGTTLFMPELPVSVLSALDSLEVLYAGDAPGLVAGTMQVNFRLPPQIPAENGEVICQLQVGTMISDAFLIYVKP